MDVLIVGAGATGTVFGAALARAGARITFHVRAPHRARVAAGLPLYRQGFFGVTPEPLENIGVTTTAAEVAAQRYDQVWFTTPSDALRQPWLDEFLPATGQATLVVLQPDPEDVDYVRDRAPGRTIIQGLIQFSAWQSPLPHEPADRQGITWMSPPGPAALLAADTDAAAQIAAQLTAGGLRTATRDDLAAHAARMSAMMNPLIAGLELADWRLARFRGHEALTLAVEAAREAVQAESAQHGSPVPLAMQLLLNGPTTRVVTWLMPWVPGFDAEAFLHYHFSKVGRQTRQLLATYQRHAIERGLPHTALTRLIGALPPPSH